ncbi:hypothetical protein BGX34_005325 [Mortierella sp. NVP85]|nr:hypothetical protein BGX34_005325 [Mortierella sp. NVP85]
MPPKRIRSSTSNKNTPKRTKTGATPSRQTRSNVSDQSEDEDSEKEIETFKDYEDAVRRRILTSTTTRYDDTREHDHLAFAASLMMTASGGMPPQDLSGDQEVSAPRPVIYSLGTFCLHAIAENFKYLASDSAAAGGGGGGGGGGGKHRHSGTLFRKQIHQLPYYLSENLFKLLKRAKPELLSTKVWTSLFFPAGQDEDSESGGGDGGGDGGKSRAGFGTNNSSHITELDLEGLFPSQVTDYAIQNHILGTLDLGPQLERINLNAMDNLSDKVLARLVGECPHLVHLSLKGCSKAGNLTMARLNQASLQELNISFVAGSAAKGIKQMIMQCRGLKILKMTGIPDIKDALFLDLAREVTAVIESTKAGQTTPPLPLSELENLKLSSTKVGDRGLKALLSLCGKTLKRLDISATNVTRVSSIAQFCVWEGEPTLQDKITHRKESGTSATEDSLTSTTPPSSPSRPKRRDTRLEKLNLTRLNIAKFTELLVLLEELPPYCLHTLLLGYMHITDEQIHQLCPYLEPDQEVSNDDANHDNNNDDTFQGITISSHLSRTNPFAPVPIVQRFHLHTLSLFGNSRVGQSKRQGYGLHLLLHRLSPFLKRLELGFTQCRTGILEGLVVSPQLDGEAIHHHHHPDLFQDNMVLEELGLDGTLIDDDAAMVFSRFRKLNRLSLANTRIGEEAVQKVIEACPLLTSLDVTSCRGIPLLRRRTLLMEVREAIAAAAIS